jgi:hypothetical protein
VGLPTNQFIELLNGLSDQQGQPLVFLAINTHLIRTGMVRKDSLGLRIILTPLARKMLAERKA